MPGEYLIAKRLPLPWVALTALLALTVAACGSSTTNLVSAPTSKCQVAVSASARSFPSDGGTGSVTVTTDRECAWTASTTSTWMSLGSPASGQGAATVTFSVAPNPVTAGRSGEIRINDQQVQIAEEAAPCRYTIDPSGMSLSAQGGSGSVNVSALAGCAWSSSSAAPSWLSVQGSGTGAGRAQFTAAANLGDERTGTLTIAGLSFTATQAAAPTPVPAPTPTPDPAPTPAPTPAPPPPPPPPPPPAPPPPVPPPCQYSVSPTSESLTAAGGAFSIAVTAGEGCGWTAASSADWLSITSGASGTGNGSVAATVAPNATTTSRTATLLIAGQTVTVTEQGLQVVQLNGTASQKSGDCPTITFTLEGPTVVANDATTYSGGGCTDVQNNARLKVTGVQTLSGTVVATAIQIQKKG